MKTDNSLGDGVFFAADDYAGFVRRFFALAVDSAILLIIAVLMWVGLTIVFWNAESKVNPEAVFFPACLGIAWLYLVPVKRSKFGTVAYRLLDMRILTIKGQRPSLFIMTLRLMIVMCWPFGPFSYLVDFVWIGVDPERRSIHDCYAGTCVVRRSDKPLGIGPMHLTYYCGAGMTLVYPRVVRLTVA